MDFQIIVLELKSLTAIARGATIIEKHFTLDKSDTTIRDHSLSLTPDEYRCGSTRQKYRKE